MAGHYLFWNTMKYRILIEAVPDDQEEWEENEDDEAVTIPPIQEEGSRYMVRTTDKYTALIFLEAVMNSMGYSPRKRGEWKQVNNYLHYSIEEGIDFHVFYGRKTRLKIAFRPLYLTGLFLPEKTNKITPLYQEETFTFPFVEVAVTTYRDAHARNMSFNVLRNAINNRTPWPY